MVLIIQLLTETPKPGTFNNREGLVVVDDSLDERQHARSRDDPWKRSSSSQTIF
ncbi:hypothetical protein Plhal304r1_c039g0117311 [Plasmopara halstedii]